jgi:hypothetical protein
MQDPQENQKFSVQEVAAAVRAKYPQFEEVGDRELVDAYVKKNPSYAEKVNFGEPVKKKIATDSPSTGEEKNYRYSPSLSREELLYKFREETKLSKDEVPDGVLAYSAAKLYPELKESLGVRTEAYQVDFDEAANKARTKKRTVVADDSEPQNAFKIIDEGDASDFLDNTMFSRIYNRAIASSEIGKITARSFYGGSIDFDELAYYSEVLEKNAAQNWMGSLGETAVGGFVADIMRTIPESGISLLDSSLSPEAVTSAAVGAVGGSAIPVVGTVTGGVAGAAFAGSSMLTFGSTLLQKISETGVDVTDPKALEEAWNDKETLLPLAKEAWAKAGMVGAFDAVSAGLGGTISRTAIKSGMNSVAKARALEYAVEGSLGGAGEALGSLAAGDEISGRDVLLEIVADPAAGILGKGAKGLGKSLKSTLGEKADPDEIAIADRLDKDQDRTLKELKISKLDNAEEISENNRQIKELEGAISAAPAAQKKILREESNRLQKENTRLHRETLDSYDEYTNEEIESMSKDADDILKLVDALENSEMSDSEKKVVTQVAENKAKALKDRKKPKGGKKINVSKTDRKTGAPSKVNPEVAKLDAQRKAEIEMLENMDASEEANSGVNSEEARQDKIKEVNEKYDSKIAEISDEQFAQPDAAQGFEEFEAAEQAAQKLDPVPATEAPAPEAATPEAPSPVEEEVDNSLSQEGKETVSQLADGLETVLDKLKSKRPEDVTAEEISEAQEALSAALSQPAKAKSKPVMDAPPMSAYEDAFEAQEMDTEDAEFMDSYLSGKTKEEKLPLGYIKQVSDAVNNPVINLSFDEKSGWKVTKAKKGKEGKTASTEEALGSTKKKVNRSLSQHFQEALTDPNTLTKFLAENAMEGDEFTVDNALYRVGKVTENKETANSYRDGVTFRNLQKFSGKTNVKDAVDNLYQKVFKKEATPQEEALLDEFERGRFKGVKNSKASIADIVSLLDVLYVTGKEGKAAVKQAVAMSNDKKPIKEMAKIVGNNLLTDKKGKAVLTKEGYKQLDLDKISQEDLTKYNILRKEAGRNKKMRQFVDRLKAGKFKEVKEGGSIVKYMSDRGITTSAGNGITRTVKFQRYSRKTGEAIPTVQSGKQKEVIGKRKTNFREYKEEQYTATIKDGVLRRKAIKSERITKIFGEKGKATYTRFKDGSEIGKAEKQSGAEYKRSKETRGKVAKTFPDNKSINALLLRPKNKFSLVSSISKVFNLHSDRAEGAADISHRLIQNMARRAGVKPSEIYDKITFVKNEYKGEVTLGESITSPRSIGTILRRFGAPISESNLDENGNPIDFSKLDQKSKPITTEFNKYKQKGVEDSFTAQMIEDLKGLGINIMSKKGSALDNISELSKDKGWDGASDIRKALGEPTSKNRLLDNEKAYNMPYIQSLVKNNIAAYLRIPVEELNQEMLDLYGIRTGQKNPILNEAKSYVEGVRGQQNQRASNWLSWLEKQGAALNENPTQESLAKYARAFSLVKSVLNYNYTSFNNPDNKLVKRTTSSVDNLTTFSEKAANKWLESDDINPAVGYNNVLNVLSEETVKDRKTKKNSDGTYWVKYNTIKGLNYEDSQTEVDALTYAASQTSWCTSSAAESHLRGGDFHILFDKNNTPVTAIRMENGKIAEERGNTPDQGLIDEYSNHLTEYKDGGFIEGYDGSLDTIKLKSEIAEARKRPFDVKKSDLYLKDIADSANPEKTLEFYKEKSNKYLEILAEELFPENSAKYDFEKGGIDNFFEDIVVLKDGLLEFGEDIFNKTVIVPKGRKAVVSSETIGVMRVKELISSDGSIEFKGFDDITIVDIKESVSSLEYSSQGYYPQIIVRDNRFEESSQYGGTNRINVFQGVAAIAFEEGIGAVEVTEGRDAWITEIAFADNNKKDGNRFRSLANIPDARVRRQLITYGPEMFDKEGYFAGVAYDETWSEGARILNQESESQSAKERYIKEHLSVGDEVTGYQRANLFDKKKDALALIKKTKADYPSLNFKVYKKSGLVTNRMDEAGKYFIHIERNPKYKETKKVDTSVRAAIALVDGEAVIFALTNPNVSSVVHEMSHMYEEYLTPQEVKVIEKFSGAKRGTVDFSETFARGFERFLADGKAPTPELKSIFSQFKEWMKNIYKSIVGSPIEKDLTPEVREIFENMIMVEGDANFREEGFKTGNVVGPVKGGVKLNQEAAKSGMRKLEEANSESKKKIAAANATKDNNSLWDKFKKEFSDRQSTIRKYMSERGLVLAESAMNARAGAGARAKYKVEPIAKKIYDGLSSAQEDLLNMYLVAKRIIQIEDNREAKREYAISKKAEFESKKKALFEAIKGKEYSAKDQKIIKESLEKINDFIARATELENKNRLYKLDDKGIETGELAFKHPKGMTKQDAQSAINEMSKKDSFKVIEKRGQLYFDAMSENLRELYEGGVIDEATYNRFKKDNYISRAFLGHIFNFELDSEGKVVETNFEDNADFYTGVGLSGDQIRELGEGSEGALITNSRYLLERAYVSSSARVLKNKAALALAKEMKGKSTSWYKEAQGKEDAFGNQNIETPSNLKGFNLVYYRENGKRRGFFMDTEAFNEWNDTELKIDRGLGMSTIRMLSGTSLLKAAATGANALFFLVNVPMDIAHVLFFTDVYDNNKLLPVNFARISKNVSKNVSGILGLDIDSNNKINVNRDTANTRRTKSLLDIYFLNGGGMDFMTQQGQELFDEKGNMITKKSLKNKAGRVLGYTGNVTELAMRLSTVEHVVSKLTKDRKNGKNSYSDTEINQIAVSKARATMDFSQGGLTAKKLDMYVPYFNAAVQAFRVSREYLSTAKGRANFANKWSQASIGVAMITFYNLLMSESDEDDDTLYDDIPDYIKDNYFIIIPPFQKRDSDGKVNYIRIRKSPNVAPFLNLSEAIARATYYRMKGIDDPKKAQSTISQFKRAGEQIATALPFVPTGASVVSKMPPTAQAAIKYVANYDPFRQMNIVSEAEYNKVLPSREGLGDERVPLFLKVFGDATGLSPKRSQAVVESYVTSPSTNFLVGGAYSILDKAASLVSDYDKTKESKYQDNFVKSVWGSGRERVVRKTNPNWRNYSYNDAQKIKEEEGAVSQEISIQSSFYSKEYRNAKSNEEKIIAVQEYKEFISTLKIPADRKRAMERFKDSIKRDPAKLEFYSQSMSVKFERDPEAAARVYDLYFEVPNLSTKEGSEKITKRINYLKKNFGFKPSKRFTNEIYRISREKYKYE